MQLEKLSRSFLWKLNIDLNILLGPEDKSFKNWKLTIQFVIGF
jgi:hypothetical protein